MVLTNQLIYLVNVKTMKKIFSNYVCFSKSPNFIKKIYALGSKIALNNFLLPLQPFRNTNFVEKGSST